MSTLKVNTIQNTGGVEKYLAAAWVNFNGTGTVAIRASGGVAGLVDNGVGDWTVNLSNAVADANHVPFAISSNSGAENNLHATPVNTTSFRILSFSQGGAVARDSAYVLAGVVR